MGINTAAAERKAPPGKTQEMTAGGTGTQNYVYEYLDIQSAILLTMLLIRYFYSYPRQCYISLRHMTIRKFYFLPH